ncbi:MAG: S8 family serine peptidase [Mycobacterium leprae]
MKKWLRTLGILFAFVLLAANLSFAAGPKDEFHDYLVGFHDGASAKGLAIAGVNVVEEWSDLGAVHVKANAAGLQGLQHNPNVAYVEEDVVRYTMGTYTDGALTWGLQAVHAQEAWNLGAKGQNIKVCILDTGIDSTQPEFKRPDGTSAIKATANFTTAPSVNDVVGHGTHVAGTIAGQTNASGSYIGVAPNVDLYIAKVLGDDGSGKSTWIINGMKWCTSTARANIASLSLGSSAGSLTEQRQFDSSYKSGLLILAAAGNAGDATLSYPAGYSSVVSIAAVDSNLAHASFSQYNSDVELAAPGVSVLSSVPVGAGSKSSATESGVSYTTNALEYAPKGNVNGPLVECGLADSTTSCTGKPASGAWIAMINRGTIAFSDKINNVIAQGASAAIIANNDTAAPDDAGSFTLGAAGNWIPTVSVSYNSGVAIRNGGLGSGNVTIEAWNYEYMNGTSMATPHASAVAALAWSANPALTNAQMRTVLQNSALDLGTAGRDTYFGYGLVQADAAVNLAKNTH